MGKKSKDARVQVILECTEQRESGVPGISRYITTKNKKNYARYVLLFYFMCTEKSFLI